MPARIIIITAAILLYGCISGSRNTVPDCIEGPNKGVLIRFGNFDNKFNNLLDGYMINDRAEIQDMDSVNQQSGTLIRRMDAEKYCGLLKRIHEEFIKVQTLNVGAERFRYIELYYPSGNTRLRAVWDPRFETFLSKGFREIYSDLEQELSTEND